MVNGCVLVDKEVGRTSRKEVDIVSARLGEKKAGHIGTLDPFANGLLIVLLGNATKISGLLEREDKAYIGTIKLGIKTDSADITGEVIETKSIPALPREKITRVLDSFLGKSMQTPPIYSALKKNGKPLYVYARKGEKVDIAPREIHIYEINLMKFENDEITFYAKVSKGTYIRMLGEDIASRLGTVGTLKELTRLSIGEFNLEKSHLAENVTLNDVIPIEKMLTNIPQLDVKGNIAKQAKNGMHIRLDIKDEIVMLKDKDGIIAIYKHDHDNVYACQRGFRWK